MLNKVMPSVLAVLFAGIFVVWLSRGDDKDRATEKVVENVAPEPARPTAPVVQPPAAPPIEVTARQLFADYDENEVSADDKYKGATLLVTGTITNIGKDVLGDPYVALDTGNPVFGVQCMFDNSGGLASLRKRERITMRCKDPGKMGNVILRNCIVAPTAPVPATPSKQRAKTEAATPENRERFAQKLKAAIGDKGDVEVRDLMLVLSTPAGGDRTCASFIQAVLQTQMDRLINLGFRQMKCEGDSIVDVIQ